MSWLMTVRYYKNVGEKPTSTVRHDSWSTDSIVILLPIIVLYLTLTDKYGC